MMKLIYDERFMETVALLLYSILQTFSAAGVCSVVMEDCERKTVRN